MELQYSIASFSFFMVFGKQICPLFLRHLPRYNNLPPGLKHHWNERTASSIHALFVTLQCIYLLTFEESIKQDVVLGCSKLADSTLAVAVGYFASDLVKVAMTFSRETDGDKLSFIMHHVASIVAFSLTLNQHLLSYFAVYRLVAEVSTPFVNLRWVLFISGYKSSRLYFYNGCLMTAAFFVSRIVLMPFFYYMIGQVLRSEGDFPRVGHTVLRSLISICVILDVLNIFWFKKMIEGIFKHFKVTSTSP